MDCKASYAVFSFVIFLLCDPVNAGVHHINKRATCVHQKYGHISGHTGCISRSNNYVSGGVTAADKQTILDDHNNYRAGVSPPAADMLKMVWDDELEMLAQKWADNCDFNHESSSYQRTIPGKFSVGQNLYTASGSPDPPKNWTTAIKAWYDEVNDFTFGSSAATGVVGHYTQLVWSTSYKIGCGFAVCTNMDTFYVCNYGPAGNNGNTNFIPYKKSDTTACSDCPATCSNNLCDCTSKPCYNGGTVNVNTCACSCYKPFYVGDTCALDCTGSTESSCGFTAAQCEPYWNVPYACPTTCGSCPHGSTPQDSSPTNTPVTQGETSPTYTPTDGSTEVSSTTPVNQQGETTTTNTPTDGSTEVSSTTNTPVNQQGETTTTHTQTDGSTQADGDFASRVSFCQPLIIVTIILARIFL